MAAKRTYQIIAVSVALFSAMFAVALTVPSPRHNASLEDEKIDAIIIGVPYTDPSRSAELDNSPFCPLEQFTQLNSDGTGSLSLMERPLAWQSCRTRLQRDPAARITPVANVGFAISSSEFDRLKLALSQLSGRLKFEPFERVGSVLPDGCNVVDDAQDFDEIGIMIVRSDETAISYTIPGRRYAALGRRECAGNSNRERQIVETFARTLPPSTQLHALDQSR